MTEFISEMRVGRKKALMPFQKGILLSNKSLMEIFPYLQEKYSSETFNIEYLLTRRFNQDVLENLFSYLRMMGGGCDHPSPLDLKLRLKWYILGKHCAYAISAANNTEGDNDCNNLFNIEDAHCDNNKLLHSTCSCRSKEIIEEDEEENIFIHAISQTDNIEGDSDCNLFHINDVNCDNQRPLHPTCLYRDENVVEKEEDKEEENILIHIEEESSIHEANKTINMKGKNSAGINSITLKLF